MGDLGFRVVDLVEHHTQALPARALLVFAVGADSRAAGFEKARPAVALGSRAGVTVKDRVELAFWFEVANRKIDRWLLAGLVGCGAFVGDLPKVFVGVGGLPR